MRGGKRSNLRCKKRITENYKVALGMARGVRKTAKGKIL
jgi:hypothetical protein